MPTTNPTPGPTVGFDLDMTLVDTRPGIRSTYRALSEESGVWVDADLAVSRLGPPLTWELKNWFPEDRVPWAVDRYRALYPDHAITTSPLLPGAVEALDAVRRAGGRSMVVTAKIGVNARMHLDFLGLAPDLLFGDLWAEAKGAALREQGASVYVGDHVGDVRGAHAAGALAVSVATGPCDAAELREAGADVLLDHGLKDFPGWLDEHLATAAGR
ncbi:HAD family hydrolase [Streptomyces spiramenti]|uniref:HAD hydrolase-like protein n=1 Tax=Streptomyces spiramenti TaxID=2720606 RepID=A0ABX1APL3_9ACTN|nr:haloacid dehalogenase-like hydrolase [Streptomyces spiramenti]NJP67020.1 HAD hydrolase-like protein [Streptomyces spiramenti]